MERSTVKIVFSAATVLFAAYFMLPWALRYPVLLGMTRVWDPDPQYANLRNTCVALHPSRLQGCEKFRIVGDRLFAACVTDWESRRKWFPPMGKFEISSEDFTVIRDSIYIVDLKTKSLTPLAMPNFPENLDFCVHGKHPRLHELMMLDCMRIYADEFSAHLWGAIGRRGGSVIENFLYKIGSEEILHVATFDGVQQGLINPNDIFAIPVSTTSDTVEKSFFVTNDHYFRSSSLGRTLERYLRLPTGSLYYHSTSTGFRKVRSRLSNANGIAGFQGNMPDSVQSLANTMFVASILDGVVTAYRYIPGKVTETGGLTKIRDFTFDFVMDNLAISLDGRWLYLTGHGEPGNLDRHWESPSDVPSASVSYRMSLTELGAYFGSKGEMGESRVEKIVVDRIGSIGNASTIAVGDDMMNKYWISGLTFRGIMECTLQTTRREIEEEDAY